MTPPVVEQGRVAEPPGGARWVKPEDVVDLFVYVTVLNLADQFFPAIITETFTLSLLTALLLKLVLEVVVRAKNRLKSRYRNANGVVGRVAAGGLLWVLLVASKFVVLELVAWAFAGQVKLGGFFLVTGLIIVLLLARSGVRWLLSR